METRNPSLPIGGAVFRLKSRSCSQRPTGSKCTGKQNAYQTLNTADSLRSVDTHGDHQKTALQLQSQTTENY